MKNKIKISTIAIFIVSFLLNLTSCKKEPTPPVVTTTNVTGITQTTASTGGNITETGGASVTAKGVCWSVTANPTTDNSKTFDGTGPGSFTCNITGLAANTLYYVRAYATNSGGTGYGNEVSFTSSPEYPKIRLKTGTGLNSGASINFLALSKDDNYFDIEDVFAFTTADADWYIDGDIIPFTTAYKDLNNTPGKYYLLLRASGLVVRSTITVVSGKQTFLISGSSYGGVDIDAEQPKGQLLFEQNSINVIDFIPDTLLQEINAIDIKAREK